MQINIEFLLFFLTLYYFILFTFNDSNVKHMPSLEGAFCHSIRDGANKRIKQISVFSFILARIIFLQIKIQSECLELYCNLTGFVLCAYEKI